MSYLHIYLIFISLYGVCAHASSRRSVIKRDDESEDVEYTPIALGVDAWNKYTVSLSMGEPVLQNFTFQISTSLGYVVVAGANSTGLTPVYNQTVSASAKPLPGIKSLTLDGQNVSGSLVSETCSLRTTTSSSRSLYTYQNQTVIVASLSNTVFPHNVSGVLGLGFPAGDFNSSFLASVFAAEPERANVSFGVLLPAEGKGGEIHLPEPDNDAYEGNVVWRDVLSPSEGNLGTHPAEWNVQVDSWTVNYGSAPLSRRQSSVALVDPFYTDIIVPQQDSLNLFANVPGASPRSGGTDLTWSIPCDTDMSFSLNVGASTFLVPKNDIVLKDGSTCYSSLRGWANASTTSLMLGSAFARSAYVIFTAFPPSSLQKSKVGFALRHTGPAGDPDARTRIIVGSVVGGASLIILAFLATWYHNYRRRRVIPSSAAYTSRPSAPNAPLSTPPTWQNEKSFAATGRKPSPPRDTGRMTPRSPPSVVPIQRQYVVEHWSPVDNQSVDSNHLAHSPPSPPPGSATPISPHEGLRIIPSPLPSPSSFSHAPSRAHSPRSFAPEM